MNRLLALGAGCALLGAAIAPAAAQNMPLDTARFSLRAGVFFPFDNSLSDLDDFWFNLGADAEFNVGIISGATTVASLDWISRNGGARDNAFPLTLSQRFYSGEWGKRVYFQVGIGATIMDFVPSDTVFSARAGIGMEFNERLFFEANLLWSDDDKSNNNTFGATAQVGIRF